MSWLFQKKALITEITESKPVPAARIEYSTPCIFEWHVCLFPILAAEQVCTVLYSGFIGDISLTIKFSPHKQRNIETAQEHKLCA